MQKPILHRHKTKKNIFEKILGIFRPPTANGQPPAAHRQPPKHQIDTKKIKKIRNFFPDFFFVFFRFYHYYSTGASPRGWLLQSSNAKKSRKKSREKIENFEKKIKRP